MSEFTKGIFNVIKGSSLALAFIYTIGHVCIAMTVVTVLTGASLWEAGLVALKGLGVNQTSPFVDQVPTACLSLTSSNANIPLVLV